MYFIAYAMQLLTLICALGGSALALLQLWQQRGDALALIEKVHWAITGALSLAAALLLHALFWNDFSLVYVASYTDRVLPAFYRLTAFWAGQPGSMLFWAFSVAISGSIFALTPAYKRLTPATRLWYWGFFYAIMAFFALILSCWSNPFEMQSPVPPDGNGLNPLLQNPGMIFHPPLLFLGYGGFTVPACLALAQSLSGGEGEDGWHRVTRPVTLLAFSKNILPAAVNLTTRLPLSKSWTPIWSSRSLTRLLTALCVMCSAAPAAVKLRSSATIKKAST